MKQHLVGVVVLLASFIGGCFITPLGEYYLGEVEAHRDISRGVYRGKRCISTCILVEPTREVERILLEELNFRIETTYSCGERMRGYNEAQFGRVRQVYGDDIVERIRERVWQKYKHQLGTSER